MSATAQPSAWTRLSRRLDKDAEGYGPLRGTLGVGRIGMIWLAANLVVTTLLTGTLFVPGVSWPMALGMIVLGTLIGGAVLVLVGNMGTRTGLPTMSLTKGSFGLRGSFLPVAANVVILMGWSWVQAMLAGVTVNFLVERATGFSSPVLFSVLCQLLVVALAIFGHKGIARVEPWLALVILAIMAYVFAVAFREFPVADFAAIPRDADAGMSAISVLDVVIATAISWTVLSAEFNRLAKSQTAGVAGSAVGYVVSTVLAMALGATAIGYVVLDGGEAVGFDPALIVAIFGAPLAVVIFLSVMATNTMVVYGMVSSVVNMVPSRRIRFLPTAVVLGAVSVLGSTWLGLLDSFTSFLTVIGALFIPVFAVMIADYYVVQKRSYSADILLGDGGRYWFRRGINAAALVAWLVGAGASVLLTYVLPSPLGATIPTFALTFVLYLGWCAVTGRVVAGRPQSLHLSESAAVADGTV
ncbi:purine-cytosine permease family protein [Arthrobacter sp. zg-Y895]|uniref:purine-cytosine permease family protein n=1 Tax=Arthrobacter sp. zg-Y895 TaxID=2886933 RepID=UPI001D13CD03|nr:cytosine permease [Arthrobacter sp. zg-Y895]MCC3301774.1 cytosine permease [Arthrobacter sp. zg-Y895]